ncbi:hypothetical protein M0R45_026985 [Rubus argutus]|uniref:Uncharacterized protein n=1 Tax=Rubus argutus TaxID=59490 RepID=A0AAW1X0W0_RUBAR
MLLPSSSTEFSAPSKSNNHLVAPIMSDAGMIGLGPFSNNNISSSASTTRPEFCFFDLVDERVSNERVQSIECIGVHRGCLRVWGWDQLDDDIIGWELKGVAGSGKLCVKHSRVYTVDPDIVPDVVEIFAFDPSDDEDIFYACNIDVDEEFNRYLAMYNIRTGKWSRIAIQDDPNDEDTYTGRLFQLVFPGWPTPVPRLSQPWLRPS